MRPHLSVSIAAIVLTASLVAGCSSASGGVAGPGVDGIDQPPAALAMETTTTAPRTVPSGGRSTTVPVPVGTGDAAVPFQPLPPVEQATAVVTPSGVVLPVLDARSPGGDAAASSWLAVTPCADVRVVSGVTPLARAHVVLDPGHGGHEYGSSSESGLVEKDLNLQVATAAARLLEERGATVVLTRTTDVTMMTSVRALIATSINPALFVSIHHNGGAPAGGEWPGTIVFTKYDDEPSSRFGGLFFQRFNAAMGPVAAERHEAFETYRSHYVAHEEAVAAYDRSLADREAALVANGQLDSAVTTVPPLTIPPVDGDEVPSVRNPVTTTTRPIPDDRVPVAVPDTLPVPSVPEALTGDRVHAFSWAGSGNAGVRAWHDGEGRDMLSVLRRSGDVPAALAEFLYVTNPVEAELLADPAFIEIEALALADAITDHLAGSIGGSGFIADQVGDQDIGGGGHANTCVEPDLGFD